MRQAGRYLPEYRALRAEKGGFLALVYDSDAAAEITLQPIRRFGFDGAILFSDILDRPLCDGPESRVPCRRGSASVAPHWSRPRSMRLSMVPAAPVSIYETVARVEGAARA